jgi:hypothetical protein
MHLSIKSIDRNPSYYNTKAKKQHQDARMRAVFGICSSFRSNVWRMGKPVGASAAAIPLNETDGQRAISP